MTVKRDSQGRPEQDPPKIEKEKLRDLDLEREAAGGVRGGALITSGPPCVQAGNHTGGCNS